MRPVIKIYINGALAKEDTSEDIGQALTWAEMYSDPGDELRVVVDYSWLSPDDKD